MLALTLNLWISWHERFKCKSIIALGKIILEFEVQLFKYLEVYKFSPIVLIACHKYLLLFL